MSSQPSFLQLYHGDKLHIDDMMMSALY